MNALDTVLERIGDAVWGWQTMALFMGVGLYFTVRLRGIQFRHLPRALRLIFHRDGDGGSSAYSALCTALAATIGTGNIVGVATALAAGGPGALFWMLLSAFFGMATQYAEGFLAVRFRKKQDGAWFGGPFCYIELGLGRRWRPLAVLFAAICAGAGILGVGTVTQINSITAAAQNFFDVGKEHIAFTLGGVGYSYATVVSGALVTFVAALVLLGGVKRISRVCELLVPFMSVLYLLVCFAVLLRCAERIPEALVLIVKSAFAPKAAFGAASGITVRRMLRMGIGRGVFTNEAGVGSSPIAAATVQDHDPVRQGLVTMTGTFIDTIVICTVTGLCLVVTGAWCAPVEGMELTDLAWCCALPWSESLSSFLMMLCLIFFAFATIIGWNFYAEQCLRYLVGRKKRALRIYRMLYIAAVAVGPYFTVRAAWEAADILNALMALPNLLALILLRRTVIDGSRRLLPKNNIGIM